MLWVPPEFRLGHMRKIFARSKVAIVETGLNNAVLPKLFIVVNNIVQH